VCSTKFVYQNLLYSIEYNKYNIWWINFRDILIRKYMQLFRVSGSKTFVKTSIFVFVQNPSFSPTSMVRLWYTSLRPLIYGTQSLTINCVKKDWHAMKLFFTFIFSNCNFQKKKLLFYPLQQFVCSDPNAMFPKNFRNCSFEPLKQFVGHSNGIIFKPVIPNRGAATHKGAVKRCLGCRQMFNLLLYYLGSYKLSFVAR